MILSKIISSTIEKGILIVKILGLGSKDIKTVFNILPFGIDSNPSKNYRAIYADTEDSGEKILLGIVFENAATSPGEMTIYSEDSNGNRATQIKLTNAGNIEMGGNTNNLSRHEVLQTQIHQLRDDLNNHIQNYNSHVHPGVLSGGSSTAITTSLSNESEIDISTAKIDNLKTS